ncbi:hypothetical protein TNCT_601631 [Trichonephila clavata]|uniref:Uncharacterized protein n=1 Tax=Trichonephila clavata TaxID=2740835 RepID=A0A8X6KEY5_TRICU|nr:hypothetical protein TNCT_601631 [Trichonephila clavata]
MILDRLCEEDNINLKKTLNIALIMSKAFKRNGVLHCIFEVSEPFVRRHIDQIRLVGFPVQNNIIPIIHQRFPSAKLRENNPHIQHAEMAKDISKDLNKELGSSFVLEVPATDVAVPHVPHSSATVTDSETRSPPVPERPFPWRSWRTFQEI